MKTVLRSGFYMILSLALFSCAGSHEPMKMDVPVTKTAPETKVTQYAFAMKDFGLMLEIYRSNPVKIVVQGFGDKTGAAQSTGAEIQGDITEIVKSTLTRMGENVVYIEYDPAFQQNMQALGYSDFADKIIPDIQLTGAITEFDRALSSWERGTDAGAEGSIAGVSKALPSKVLGIDFSDSAAGTKARITVDFNLQDFLRRVSIPGMNVTSTMEVQKGMAKKEFSVTVFGPTFGTNGTQKIVQGRHDAIRQLVETSMIQLLGKRAGVPYWRVFGEGAIPDEDVVIKSWRRDYSSKLTDKDKTALKQRYLYLHGYDCTPTGNMDDKTMNAINDFKAKRGLSSDLSDFEVFWKIYSTVPINEKTYERAAALYAGKPMGAGDTSVISSSMGRAANLLSEGYKAFTAGDYGKALAFYEESLKAAPTPVAYYLIALCYDSMNQKNNAIARLEEGAKAFNDFILYKALGLDYKSIGDNAKAAKAFEAALAIRPNDKKVKSLLELK